MKASTEFFLPAIFATVMVFSAATFTAAKDPIAASFVEDLPIEALSAEKIVAYSPYETEKMSALEMRIEESRKAIFGFRRDADDDVLDISGLTTERLEPYEPEFNFDYTGADSRRSKGDSPSAFLYRPETLRRHTDPDRSMYWPTFDESMSYLPLSNALLNEPKDLRSDKGFRWRPAIYQSLMMIGVQHAYALGFQEKTRRALKGPFFRDYWRSLKGLHGWDDGNRFFTNYIAHPMQGALTGFIYLQNQPRTKNQRFGMAKDYWHDRLIAFIWSTAWSTQWELGPISQSTLGNLGMYGGMAYVDLVITPTVGTAWLVAEEAMDRYVITKWEKGGMTVKILARMLLNPMRTMGNILRFKEPWYRDRPFGMSRIPIGQLTGR